MIVVATITFWGVVWGRIPCTLGMPGVPLCEFGEVVGVRMIERECSP